MSQGILISLDGVDGAGKSTQCEALVASLRSIGERVTACRDPGGTAMGQRIRELLLDRRNDMSLRCEAFLYMASRAQLCDEIIRPALARGDVVISDRFLLANVVYQGHAGGLPPQTLWQLGSVATGGLQPDLTLLLDLPPHPALARKEGPADRLESRGLDYLTRVREGFLTEARLQPNTIKVIDASQSREAVAAAIRQEVQRALDARSRT